MLIVVSFDVELDSSFYFDLPAAECTFVVNKKVIFNVLSRRAVDSSKGLGNSGSETISLCLTLDTLFAAILFVIAVKFFKAEGPLKGKSKRRHGQLQPWRGKGEKRSRLKNQKFGSPFKPVAKIRGFKVFFLFLLLAAVSGVNVDNMNGLFNTVSNYACGGCNPIVAAGNSIMPNGDTAVLAVGVYECSGGTCAASHSMLQTSGLDGEVKCEEDTAVCVLNGEGTRRGMHVSGTGASTLLLRALSFIDGGFVEGVSGTGGGVYIVSGAIVTIELCVFSNCRATSSSYGGGAIWVESSATTVNVYGTSFNDNTAASGNGDDIYRRGGTITIHNTCPSPYSSNTPTRGEFK